MNEIGFRNLKMLRDDAERRGLAELRACYAGAAFRFALEHITGMIAQIRREYGNSPGRAADMPSAEALKALTRKWSRDG